LRELRKNKKSKSIICTCNGGEKARFAKPKFILEIGRSAKTDERGVEEWTVVKHMFPQTKRRSTQKSSSGWPDVRRGIN